MPSERKHPRRLFSAFLRDGVAAMTTFEVTHAICLLVPPLAILAEHVFQYCDGVGVLCRRENKSPLCCRHERSSKLRKLPQRQEFILEGDKNAG